MYLFDYIKRLEERKGRKLDLNQYTDIYHLAEIVEREINLRNSKEVDGLNDELIRQRNIITKAQRLLKQL
jgi:hypothetical protein